MRLLSTAGPRTRVYLYLLRRPARNLAAGDVAKGSRAELVRRALGTAVCSIQLVHISPRAAFADTATKELRKATAAFCEADEGAETIQHIKAAILSETAEFLDSNRALTLGLETARGTYARRGNDFAPDPTQVEMLARIRRATTPEDTA